MIEIVSLTPSGLGSLMVTWVSTVRPPYMLLASNLNSSSAEPITVSSIHNHSYVLAVMGDIRSCDAYSFQVTGQLNSVEIRSEVFMGNIPSLPDFFVQEGSLQYFLTKSQTGMELVSMTITFNVSTVELLIKDPPRKGQPPNGHKSGPLSHSGSSFLTPRRGQPLNRINGPFIQRFYCTYIA